MSDEAGKNGDGRGEFLTARQIAEILQVSETTVRRLAREGHIPVVRVTPRLARYNLGAVLRALGGGDSAKSRTRGARPAAKDDQQLSFEELK